MEKRVEVLKEYELLDTLPESEFDDIVELASVFFDMPISLISLLDSHRQWFKARIGLAAAETPIEAAFCYHAIQVPGEVMVVPDSLADDRFRDNPLTTGSPHVRFYAGAPLVTDEGYAIGTLCVIDKQPRTFTDEQKRVLRILGDKVIERFESRKQNLRNKRLVADSDYKLQLALARLLEAEKIGKLGNWDINLITGEVYWSAEMYRIYGMQQGLDTVDLEAWFGMVHPDDLEAAQETVGRQRETVYAGQQEFRIRRADGSEIWLLSQFKGFENGHLIGTTMDITDRKEAEESKKRYTAALEETLYALSHKIRKPTANIMGIVSNLNVSAVPAEHDDEWVPYLKAASDELDSYIRELNDFIQKQKIQIGHQPSRA